MECKDIYSELSKIIQSVLASRKELVKYDTHKGEMADKEVDQENGPHLLSPTPSPSITPSVMRVSPCHYIIIISIPKLYSIPVPCPIDHTSNHTPSSLPTTRGDVMVVPLQLLNTASLCSRPSPSRPAPVVRWCRRNSYESWWRST